MMPNKSKFPDAPKRPNFNSREEYLKEYRAWYQRTVVGPKRKAKRHADGLRTYKTVEDIEGKPLRKDYVDIKDYNREYGRWYYRNVACKKKRYRKARTSEDRARQALDVTLKADIKRYAEAEIAISHHVEFLDYYATVDLDVEASTYLLENCDLYKNLY